MKYLAPCNQIIGSTHVNTNLPSVEIKSGLLYMPVGVGRTGGIFNVEGHAIPEAINFRGEDRMPINQTLRVSVPPETHRYNGAPLIYLGTIYPHFGHFITTTLSRFWYILQTRERPLRLLWNNLGAPLGLFGRRYIAEVFSAIGITPDNFVTFSHPTIIESAIIFPMPSFEENYGASATFVECSREIGRRILGSTAKEINATVYLSKAHLPSGVRGFVNEGDVELELKRHGVHVAYPESYPLPDQLALLASHKNIMGSVGSAMHSSIFLSRGKRIVGLNQTAQLNSNFLTLDQLCGNISTYAYPLDLEEVDDARFNRAFRLAYPKEIAQELLSAL